MKIIYFQEHCITPHPLNYRVNIFNTDLDGHRLFLLVEGKNLEEMGEHHSYKVNMWTGRQTLKPTPGVAAAAPRHAMQAHGSPGNKHTMHGEAGAGKHSSAPTSPHSSYLHLSRTKEPTTVSDSCLTNWRNTCRTDRYQPPRHKSHPPHRISWAPTEIFAIPILPSEARRLGEELSSTKRSRVVYSRPVLLI